MAVATVRRTAARGAGRPEVSAVEAVFQGSLSFGKQNLLSQLERVEQDKRITGQRAGASFGYPGDAGEGGRNPLLIIATVIKSLHGEP